MPPVTTAPPARRPLALGGAAAGRRAALAPPAAAPSSSPPPTDDDRHAKYDPANQKWDPNKKYDPLAFMTPGATAAYPLEYPPLPTEPGRPEEPLLRQIGTQRLDALFSDDVDAAHSAYWFTTPAGGWPTAADRVAVPSAPAGDVAAVSAARPDSERWRAPLQGEGAVCVGAVLDGAVSAATFAAGVLVDVGAAFDGLLPVASERAAWAPLAGARLPLGARVRVRVTHVSPAPAARFPLLLDIVDEPGLVGVFQTPAQVGPGAFDLRGGLSTAPDDVLDAVTAGGWAGGRDAEITVLPSGSHSGQDDNILAVARRELGDEVAAWLAARDAADAGPAAAVDGAAGETEAPLSSSSSSPQPAEGGLGGAWAEAVVVMDDMGEVWW